MRKRVLPTWNGRSTRIPALTSRDSQGAIHPPVFSFAKSFWSWSLIASYRTFRIAVRLRRSRSDGCFARIVPNRLVCMDFSGDEMVGNNFIRDSIRIRAKNLNQDQDNPFIWKDLEQSARNLCRFASTSSATCLPVSLGPCYFSRACHFAACHSSPFAFFGLLSFSACRATMVGGALRTVRLKGSRTKAI